MAFLPDCTGRPGRDFRWSSPIIVPISLATISATSTGRSPHAPIGGSSSSTRKRPTSARPSCSTSAARWPGRGAPRRALDQARLRRAARGRARAPASAPTRRGRVSSASTTSFARAFRRGPHRPVAPHRRRARRAGRRPRVASRPRRSGRRHASSARRGMVVLISDLLVDSRRRRSSRCAGSRRRASTSPCCTSWIPAERDLTLPAKRCSPTRRPGSRSPPSVADVRAAYRTRSMRSIAEWRRRSARRHRCGLRASFSTDRAIRRPACARAFAARQRASRVSFLAPLYLLLGAAAAVPLLLHLHAAPHRARVDFPAARYLAARRGGAQSRSLKLRNLLLMMLRVLAVLAHRARRRATVPPLARRRATPRRPSPIVLDNSLSTSAVVGGQPLFDRLRSDGARVILASTADRPALARHRRTAACAAARATRCSTSSRASRRRRRRRSRARAARAPRSSCVPRRLPRDRSRSLTDGQRTAWASARALGDVRSCCTCRPALRRAIAPCSSPWRDPRAGRRAEQSPRALDRPIRSTYRIIARTVARSRAAPRRATRRSCCAPRRPSAGGMRAGRARARRAARPTTCATSRSGSAPRPRSRSIRSPALRASALDTLVAERARERLGNDIALGPPTRRTQLPALLIAPPDPVRARRRQSRPRAARRAVALRRRAARRVRGRAVDSTRALERCDHQRYPLARPPERSRHGHPRDGGRRTVDRRGRALCARRLSARPPRDHFPVRAPFVPWLADMLALRLGAPPETSALRSRRARRAHPAPRRRGRPRESGGRA